MRKALVLCVVWSAILGLTACDDQPLEPNPTSEIQPASPSFAKGGIPGPPDWVDLPRTIGPPPRVPVPLPPQAGPPAFLDEAVAVGAGYFFSCALRSDGAALCWGTNSKGELGDGTTNPSSTPVRVSGGHEFTRLFVGDDRACGITADLTAYCWGSNNAGQLGAGEAAGAFSTEPVPVAGGHHFRSLSLGLRSSCGVAEDGIAYCWGLNNQSQLGVDLPQWVSAYTPMPVINSAALGLVTVNNGFSTTCGLDAGGSVFCWGLDRGNFGNGSGDGVIYPTPTPAAGGMTFATVELGSLHVCGLDQAGSAYCWGRRNLLGEQGNGTTTPSWSPTAVLGGLTFASIDTDDTNRSFKTVCGVTPSGEAWCWGNNRNGNLGAPSSEICYFSPNYPELDCSTTPVPVSGGIEWASVAVGADHTCGLSADGRVFCWGRNDHGELGDGTLIQSPVPVRVRGLIGG